MKLSVPTIQSPFRTGIEKFDTWDLTAHLTNPIEEKVEVIIEK